MTPHIWTPDQKPVLPPGLRKPIFPGERGWAEAFRLAGLVNGGMVNGGHAMVNGGVIRAKSVPLPTSVAWYKAGVGQFTTSGGGTPSTDGNPVGLWQDQSGNSRDVLQDGNDAWRGTLRGNLLNGYPAVEFGQLDFVQIAAGSYTLSAPWTIVAAVRQLTHAANPYGIVGSSTSGLTQVSPSPNLQMYLNGSLVLGPLTTLALNTWAIIAMKHNTDSTMYLRHNLNTALTGTGTGTFSLTRISIGDLTNYSGGSSQVAEAMYCDSVLSVANEETVINYMAAKFGITV